MPQLRAAHPLTLGALAGVFSSLAADRNLPADMRQFFAEAAKVLETERDSRPAGAERYVTLTSIPRLSNFGVMHLVRMLGEIAALRSANGPAGFAPVINEFKAVLSSEVDRRKERR